MDITSWKRNEIEEKFNNCKNLGDVISVIESEFGKKGHLVCEIVVNGRPLSEEDELEMKAYDFNLIEEVSVKSSTQEALAKESTQSLTQLLLEIESELIVSSEFFRMVELHGKGQEKFDHAIKNCQLAMDLCTYMVQSSLKPSVKMEWQAIRSQFLSLSHQVHTAFQKKDYVLLADVLEYEFSNLLQSWKSWISNCNL